jgi:hypothetical protein
VTRCKARVVSWLAALLLPITASQAAKTSRPDAIIERDRTSWTVTFALPERRAAWAFSHSNGRMSDQKSWRIGNWVPLTPDVQLKRIGRYDVITPVRGKILPRKIRFVFTPDDSNLLADYDPAIIFSADSVALFTGHFFLGAYDQTTGEISRPKQSPAIKFIDKGGKIWVNGNPYGSGSFEGDERYVLLGDIQPKEDTNFWTLIDPKMPEWMQIETVAHTKLAMDAFTERLGDPGLSRKPSIWAVWKGSNEKGLGLAGSVLPSFIHYSFSGEVARKRSDSVSTALRWTLAHESAHFWLGQKVNYAGNGRQWISEGGANALAMALIAENDKSYDDKAELKNWANICRKSLAAGPISLAWQRNDYDAYYHCGAIFYLVAAKDSKLGLFPMTRKMLDAEYAKDRSISTEEWLDYAKTYGVKSELIAAMRSLIDGTSASPNDSLMLLLSSLENASLGKG